jgi:hypothetical protein
MSIFEAGMLFCFGAAWPVNIYKSLKSRSTGGKSILFLFVLETGYVFGILNKILYSRDIVLFLYIINFLMVMVDIALFYRNRRIERNGAPRKNQDTLP